ncbi:hypothetical protein ALP52_00828 [Pseudomonas amygdali pv. mori]|uniref:Uncharacterized protein n=1 Tax=Pseudomonas amygdali pv. mori TaxID=34065 RepID=A0A3M5IN68_PSEA0|nr:hypothetical protein [Pseudomonas amygdali]RMT12406.1 hypothetical protein ALP52_00828 [Pseudomonas amygdali pv. mori]
MISIFIKSKRPEKVIDESVLTDAFVKAVKERLVRCLLKSVQEVPIVVPVSNFHSPNGREWLLAAGEGYQIRDMAHLQAKLLKGMMVNLALEFSISATDEGQFCLSVLLDESQSLIQTVIATADRVIGDLPEDLASGALEPLQAAYLSTSSRYLVKDLNDYLSESPRLTEALARLEGSKGPHLVSVAGGLKSILDRTLQKDKPVLFDDLYTRDTSNTFNKEAQ